MSGQILYGKAVAARLRANLAIAVAQLPVPPQLAVILVGDDPASHVYVGAKAKATVEAGMRSHEVRLPASVAQAALEAELTRLSHDPDVDGILLQLPLPQGLDEAAALARIDPAKDVDGLTETSAGRLVLGKPGLRPCTPVGTVMLAKAAQADLSGAHCVVIGRSILVGKPAALLFLEQNCTVTMAHSRTRDLPDLCRSADVLVPAIGRAEMVRGDWIKPGAIVLDVGINRIPAPDKGAGKTRLVGDVAFAEAQERAGWITPVPGGIGPMTIACLLRNTVIAACGRRGWAVPDGVD
jgi:methylenetetrahydrofolate dehydrogenase (NADP+)/methenyltetrahydrofolate cyclohydrolase